MKTKKMALSWIVVSDLEKSLAFFTQTLGLKILNQSDEFGWAELGAEEGETILGVAKGSETNPIAVGSNAVVTFTIPNLESGIETIKKAGIKLVGEVIEIPGHVKMQLFQDRDENYMQLVEKLD